MKTLHQELTDIILNSTGDIDTAHEAAGAVIEKILEVAPKEKYTEYKSVAAADCRESFIEEGWNLYHDTLKELLMEGTK